VLDDYLAMRKKDPGFEPAHPVMAAGMRAVEGIEPGVYITDPATGGCSDLINAVYELILQMIARRKTSAWFGQLMLVSGTSLM
jgi:hypothetical protein